VLLDGTIFILYCTYRCIIHSLSHFKDTAMPTTACQYLLYSLMSDASLKAEFWLKFSSLKQFSKAPFTLGLISKLISKFMLIYSYHKKISSVNSQLLKEINFEIIFRNLEHVLFCKISQKKFHLWSALIGQSATVYKHRMKRHRCWFTKVYFQ